MQLKGAELGSKQSRYLYLAQLQATIVLNWNLPDDRVKKCVNPDCWPNRQTDTFQWSNDVLHLLLKASKLSKGNNQLFQDLLSKEILAPKKRNASARGTTTCVPATDLKRVRKRLE